MSYLDKVDRKKSIANAKRELEHFSDLYKLNIMPEHTMSLNAVSYDPVMTIMKCLNYDRKNINAIAKKDRQLNEIKNILAIMAKLEKKDLEYIYSRYVLMETTEKIMRDLNLSDRSLSRVRNDALFNMALALGVEVLKPRRKISDIEYGEKLA